MRRCLIVLNWQLYASILVALFALVLVRPATAEECPIVEAPAKFPYVKKGPDEGIRPAGFVSLRNIPVVHGIDVSKWQQSVDLLKVKACGGRFAYVRLSVGNSPKRENAYAEHWGQARGAQLMVGPYHHFSLVPDAPIDSLEAANTHFAQLQAQLFLQRLREVLGLEKQDEPHRVGAPYLPIALALDEPAPARYSKFERVRVNRVWHAAVCAWIETVKAHHSTRSQPVILFLRAHTYKDYDFKSSRCGIATSMIWLKQPTTNGAGELGDGTDEQKRTISEVCLRSDQSSRCIIHQYTSVGGFALQQKYEGLDLNRFYGTEAQLQRLLQRMLKN